MRYRILQIVLLALIYVNLGLFGQTERKNKIALTEILTIGDTLGSTFSEVGDIAIDGQENIYVTDRYQFKIKKFSQNGNLLAEYGKRGKGVGEFQSGPARIELSDNLVAVSDVGTAKIVLLTKDLHPIGDFNTVGPIVDIAQFQGDHMWCSVLTLSGDTSEILALYSKTGEVITRIPVMDPSSLTTLQVLWLCGDHRNGLIAAYSFRNRIMVYDPSMRLISSFRINGLPDEAPTDTIAEGQFGIVPNLVLIRAVAAYSDSLIFVLSGDFSSHPSRDMYVFDYRGNLLETCILPHETGLLYVDAKGYLYTREHNKTLIKKYNMKLSKHYSQKVMK